MATVSVSMGSWIKLFRLQIVGLTTANRARALAGKGSGCVAFARCDNVGDKGGSYGAASTLLARSRLRCAIYVRQFMFLESQMPVS